MSSDRRELIQVSRIQLPVACLDLFDERQQPFHQGRFKRVTLREIEDRAELCRDFGFALVDDRST